MAVMKVCPDKRNKVWGENSCSAITVLELMVVIAIIALLSVAALPAIRGMTRSNTIASANRQLLDDIALARQRAINERSIVRVLLIPTNVFRIADYPPKPGPDPGSLRDRKVLTNLWSGAQIRYALYAERSAGDQPGQHHPRYLTSWRTLPEGVFIPLREYDRLQKVQVPFPTIDGDVYTLANIAFDHSGAVVDPVGNRRPEGEFLELARGSVMFQRNDIQEVIFFDVRENPPGNSINNFNRVRIDGLTGRARIERPEIE